MCLHINDWKKNHRINHKPEIRQNAALSLNGMLEQSINWILDAFRTASSSGMAWVNKAYARSLAPWAILSISGYDDTTSPHQTF